MHPDTTGDTILFGKKGALRIPSTECWNGSVGGPMKAVSYTHLIIDPKQQKQIETVKADLLNGHTDTEKLNTLQREIYACIAPIDIGKVWNVVAVVDAGIVTKNLQTVIVSTILMICWVVLLFLIGAAYYLWNKHRSEKKLY